MTNDTQRQPSADIAIRSGRYICHFTPDDKFIDLEFGNFDLLPGRNRIFVFGEHRSLQYIHHAPVEFVSIQAAKAIVADKECAAVIFHALTSDCLPLLGTIPKDKLVVWLGWGYDYYDMLLSGAFPGGRYLTKTRQLMQNILGKDALNNRFRRATAAPELRIALNRIDLFACMETEYDLILRENPWFEPKLFTPWTYGDPEISSSQGRSDQGGERNDILVGNSASPENNHLDAFERIAALPDLAGRRLLVPLSYGDADYRQQVIAAGKATFGDAFVPLVEYMDRSTYAELISGCGYFVMNHVRQQAVGNVVIGLLNGARVFMNAASPFYQLLKNIGAHVDTTDRLELAPLSTESVESNIRVIRGRWGVEAQRDSVARLGALIQARTTMWQTAMATENGPQFPKFSVVMPVYNRERYVKEAIESVLAQDDADFELIVIDDGSTDRSLEIIEAIDDPRLKLLRNQHGGGPAARNTGIQAARGDFIVWIDSDDRQAQGALSALRQAMQSCPDADVYYGDLEIFNEAQPGTVWHTHYPDYYGESLLPRLIQGNCLPNPGTAVRRALYQRYGGYDNKFVRCHDFHMWTRLADSARFKKVSRILCHWRQHGESLSNIKSRAFEAKVAVDMVNRYPSSRLYPDLQDDAAGQGQALWRVSQTLEAMGELAEALRLAYRAIPLGAGDRDRIQKLEHLAGNVYEPFFTVVLTTFNRPQLLLSALDSLEKQSFRDFEVILVNDHGHPVEHLLCENKFPVTYVCQGRNQGPAAARNVAHRLAAGRHVVYLDDDDLFLPCHLQVLADALAVYPDSVVYTDALFLTEKIEGGVRHVLGEERRYRHEQFSRQRLSVDNYIPINTFAWPRALMAEIGYFDESLSGLEDWDFLLRLASKARFHHVPRETVQVRMRAESGERRSEHAFKDYPALYRLIYARHADLGDEEVRSQRTARLKQMGGLSPAGANETLEQWRARRIPDDRQRQQAGQWIESQGRRPRIGLLTLDRQAGRLQARMLAAEESAQAGYAGQGVDLDTSRPGAAFNATIAAWDVDWLVVADAGTEFAPGGLLRLRMELAAQPQLRALYADEWYRNDAGVLAPTLRPDLNLDLLLGNPTMLAKHWVFRRDALLDAGGFDPEAGDAVELDLILRLIQKDGFDGIVHLPEPLLTCAPPRFDAQAQQRVILRHLHARGYAGATVESAGAGLYRIGYGHERRPAVSMVVVVAPDTALAALERCVVSLLEKTGYPDYELLLVDNGASAQTRQWMQQVETLAAARVRAFAFDPPLPHAAACNVAATQATGEFLLFLRPEVAALQPQWLDELLNHGLRPEVGIVGGKTISADGKVTHAGLVPGLLSSGGRAFAGSPMDAPGYMNRLQVAQNYSAVADSCLLIDKALFVELDGFDHAAFADEGADVDLCLRARQRGYLTVWTPHALLLHSPDAAPLPEAASDALLERWLPALAHDPAYNPNLRLDVPGGFRLGESDFSWQPLPWRPVPRVLAHPADPWGSGQYRVIQPFEALRAAGDAEGALYATLLDTVEQARIDPDVVVLQRRVSDEDLERMRRMPRFSRALKVYELDDYLPNLPLKSVHREHMPRDILRTLRQAFGLVDRIVVSTPDLAEAFAGLHPDIRIARNRLPLNWWKNLPAPRRNTSPRPRVGWAGGAGHTGDLEMVADVVVELARDVDWVFFGMCPERLRPHVAEFHPGVDIQTYPRFLARLNLDLAIAPLEQNRFNECKSNLRLLEYGACAVPVVCSDVGPYRDDGLPVTRVRNRHRDWVGAIRAHLADAQARADAGDALRAVVHRDWMLADAGLAEWRAAWLP